MTKSFQFDNPLMFKRIKIISNPARFRILELLEENEMTVTQIGKTIKINYRRCSEYIRKMEKTGMVSKRRHGKESFVKSRVKLSNDSLKFE